MTPKKSMPSDTTGEDQPIVCFGPFRLDRQLQSLYRGEQRVRFAAKPLATLEFLIRNCRRVVDKKELLREVWGGQQEINTVEQAVRQARKVLEDNQTQPRYIETVPGQGYRFIADVHAPAPAGNATNGSLSGPSRRRLLYAAALGAPAVCLAGFAANRFLRQPDRVARVAVNGRSLVALNAVGHVLWAHDFEAPLRDTPPEEAAWRTQVVDIDGDGVPEILLVAAGAREYLSTSEQLFCFSSRGKMLWQYEPQVHVEFGTPGMKGPWKFYDVLVTPGRGAASIWVAIDHAVWWPSVIVRLSARGVDKLIFANPGNIRALRRIETESGPYIVAAGINNGYRKAFAAMLPEDAPPAASPEATEPGYRCIRGCPSGRPYRYILSPQSEAGAAVSPYSIADGILARPGGLTVQTAEVREGEFRPRGFFYFSNAGEAGTHHTQFQGLRRAEESRNSRRV
jgi:DNA-binding winged helix-turn-helix (wHTH) protein